MSPKSEGLITNSPKQILKSDLSPGSCVICDAESHLRSMHEDYTHNGSTENLSSMLAICFNIKLVGLYCSDESSEICETCTTHLRDAYTFRRQIEALDETFYPEISLDVFMEDDKAKYSDFTFADADDDNYLSLKSENECDTQPKLKKAKVKKKKKLKKQAITPGAPQQLKPFCTTCPVCMQKFNVPRDLTRHYATHFPNFVCGVCGKAWLDKKRFTEHVRRHENRRHPCDRCEQTFANRNTLTTHVKLRHEGLAGLHRCRLCKERFMSYSERNKHLTSVHGQPARVYTCTMCERTFAQTSRLSEHLKKCRRQRMSRICSFCDTKLNNKDDYECHMFLNHPDIPIHEDESGNSFWSTDVKIENNLDHKTPPDGELDDNDRNSDNEPLSKKTGTAYLERRKTKIPPLEPYCTTCPVCDEKFNVPLALSRHYATHFPNFVCHVCGKSWLRKRNLQVHIKTHVVQRHPCKICKQTYANRSALSTHMKVKHEGLIGVHRCKFCRERFSSYPDRNRHLSEVHGQKRRVYTCKTCDKTFFRSSTFANHLKRHHPQLDNFCCDVCNKKFNSKTDLNTHKLIHEGSQETDAKDKVQPYDSNTVDGDGNVDQNSSQNNFSRAKSKSEKYPPPLAHFCTTCPVCCVTFNMPRELNRHYATHFPNFVCNICGKSWLSKKNLEAHVKRHAAQRLQCQSCPQTFANRNGLMTHTKVKHEGLKGVHRCKICLERFASYTERNKHLSDVHGQASPSYSCVTCKKTFSHTSRFSEHLKRFHLQKRDHCCTVCDSKFYSKTELNNHMLRHTGEKNFCCYVCGKSYARKKNLSQHLKIHNVQG